MDYRFYKHFSNEAYRESLINKLFMENSVKMMISKDYLTSV